jgi:hypothetical protein
VKNYFEILELPVGASAQAIRQAFRRLAKKYHPDVSQLPLAHERFMEIQEAYEFLMDDAQRINFMHLWNQQYRNRQEQFRREQIYKLWVAHQTKKQAESKNQHRVYNQYKKVEQLSSFWIGVHWIVNAIFLIFFVLMITIPLYRYIHQDELEITQQRPFIYYFCPILAGCIFLIAGYYYWFVVKTDREP